MRISESGMRYVGVSAFFFALLQSLCPAVIALSAVRLAIGVGAVAFAAGTVSFLRTYHGDAIRLPMMALALAGATLNLFVIWHLRRLRRRPAAQWRLAPITKQKLRSEQVQIVLSALTFVVLATEWFTHLSMHHHI